MSRHHLGSFDSAAARRGFAARREEMGVAQALASLGVVCALIVIVTLTLGLL